MSVEFPILGGGGSTEPDGLWQPHWGVDIEPYATSGKIAILVRDDLYHSFLCQTSGGANYRVTVYTTAGSSFTDHLSNSIYDFDYTAYLNSFPDITGSVNGHGTYVITVEATAGDLSNYTPKAATGKVANTATGALWIVLNTPNLSTNFVVASSSGIWGRHVESVEFLAGAVTVYGGYVAYSLRKFTGYSHVANTAINNMFEGAVQLREATHHLDATSYNSMYAGCYNIDNDVSGIYPNATTMASTFVNNYRRKSIDITAPNLTSFANNTAMNSLKVLRIRQSNFRGGTGTVFAINNAGNMDDAALATLAADIGAWELAQGGAGCLTGKIFVFTGCGGAATFDATPLTDLGATVTR